MPSVHDLPDEPYVHALLEAGMSREEIVKGTRLFLSGEFIPLRHQEHEDRRVVARIDAQDADSVSGVLLRILGETDPSSDTRIYGINRFIFLAHGGTGKQKFAG